MEPLLVGSFLSDCRSLDSKLTTSIFCRRLKPRFLPSTLSYPGFLLVQELGKGGGGGGGRRLRIWYTNRKLNGSKFDIVLICDVITTSQCCYNGVITQVFGVHTFKYISDQEKLWQWYFTQIPSILDFYKIMLIRNRNISYISDLENNKQSVINW